MDMAGLAKQFSTGEAAVRAIEAGADVLLMPPDPDVAIRAVLRAVGSGRLSRTRIDESAQRVLEAKVRVGLNKKKLVDVDGVSDALESPEEAAHAQDIADRAVTLVRNQGEVLPLTAPNQACMIISSGLRISAFGQRMAEEFRARAPQARIVFVDNTLPAAALDTTMDTALANAAGGGPGCSAVVFATFTTNPALNGELPAFVQKLTAGATPVAFVSLGSPYLLQDFPQAAAAMAAFSTAAPSESSVVKALLGEIAITGKLPVTIPNVAAYGDGIELPARTQPSPSGN